MSERRPTLASVGECATVDYEKKEEAQEIAMLSRKLVEQTIAVIVDGDGRSFADSGELLRGRTVDYRRLELSLLDSLLYDGIGSMAHLLGHSRDSRVLSVTLPKRTPATVTVDSERVERKMGN
jgi:hypothetical protein